MRKPKPQKRFFSLLEVLVSIALALGILSGTLFFWRWIALSEQKLQQDEELAFSLRTLEARLSELLSESNFERDKEKQNKKGEAEKTLFFLAPEETGLTRGPSLFFTYFNDSLSPLWRGALLGRLLIDSKKRLLIASWPYPKPSNIEKIPIHLEVLMENVEMIEFEFLPREDEALFPDIQRGIFTSTWRREFDLRPIAIKIRLYMPYPHTLAIPLPPCSRNEEEEP
jgi:hypothetical protein